MDGTVAWYDVEKGFGFVKTDDGHQYFFHESFLVDDDRLALEAGKAVSFDPADSERGPQAHSVRLKPAGEPSVANPQDVGHQKHCFVVMPFGREPKEIRWFRGWYETVIEPAIRQSGYDPILAATEERPNAINDEIRAHLALDPMVAVDLAGASPDEPPNPNVMYELGIRHALNLPLVMLAWKGQRLPFDISNQRVIMEDRELLDLEPNRQKLFSFIAAASEGHYYRPMEAVGRIATLDYASASLGRESLLGLLAREVRDLRRSVSKQGLSASGASQQPRPGRQGTKKQFQLAHLLTTEEKRSLRLVYLDAGGDLEGWSRLLGSKIGAFSDDDPSAWAPEDWNRFVRDAAQDKLQLRLEFDEQVARAKTDSTELNERSRDASGEIKSEEEGMPTDEGPHDSRLRNA